ncbi:hypothetical protein DEFDS_0949 [Deferribacter desulfuricans SSM1]|uniref:diguanylate cyclase n=1 Tax=Deferribacter desulfuricans (strain DSM 14783 / JCM 11476 / NBRC 101012 / SSM1) TaxID=639282 RepID=D3PCU8_DEFDS|nr:GGDEF domain-containing protein [Deferribacter desulfuricans]BAI80421.1 hypothetical protein DEFDS_0949 [Deferribacter desulfuricans SSM1]
MNDHILLCITKDESIPDELLTKNVFVRTTLKSAINEIMHKSLNKIIISEAFFKKYSLVIQLIANVIYEQPVECYMISENSYYTFSDVTIIKIENLKNIIQKKEKKKNISYSDEKTNIFLYNIIKLAITNNIYHLFQIYKDDFDSTIIKLLDILEKIFLPVNLLLVIKQDYEYKAFISNNSNNLCCNLLKIISSHNNLNQDNIIIYRENNSDAVKIPKTDLKNKLFKLNDDIYYLIQFDEDPPFDEKLLEFAITYSNLLISFLLSQKSRQQEIVSDYLTKIYNRKFFDETLKYTIKSSKRHKTPYSLISFDIDNFKKINDNFGHDKGDTVLIELSNIVKSNLRQSDIFARIGGEEFAIILPQTNFKGASILAEKIREHVENHHFSFNKEYTVTISLGLISIEEDFDVDFNTLYKLVDNALYQAKKEGKNRVVAQRL